MNIQNKRVRDAVSSLIQTHPLFAGILIQQKFQEDNSEANPTFAVDGETFFYNSAFADSLTFDECKGVCAHEASHLALAHHCRMGKRDPETWNKAADYAINARLLADKLTLPKGALLDPKFADMSAEDIYRQLDAQKRQQTPQPQPSPAKQSPQGPPQSGQGASGAGQGKTPGKPSPGAGQGQGKPQSGQGGPSSGQPSQGSQGQGTGQGGANAPCPTGKVLPSPQPNAKAAEAKAKGQVQKAMAIARMAGQLPGGMVRAIEQATQPRFDWREVLHRFFQELTARDYSFATPNKRFAHTGVILPSLRSRDIGRVILAVDTSGSVSEAEVSAMVGELQNCLDTYSENGLAQGLRVVYCDASVQGEETLESGDVAHPKGGGGTAFAPVFAHLAGDLDGAACLVYLTDGYTTAGDLATCATFAPSFPVLWGLICDNPGFIPPFGETFKMDIHA